MVSLLQLSIADLQVKSTELEARVLKRRGKSTEAEDSARSQRLKRRKNGEPAEGPSSSGTKRARTKAGVAASDNQDVILQDLIDDETRSDLDKLD